jgi:hypothetical protein
MSSETAIWRYRAPQQEIQKYGVKSASFRFLRSRFGWCTVNSCNGFFTLAIPTALCRPILRFDSACPVYVSQATDRSYRSWYDS